MLHSASFLRPVALGSLLVCLIIGSALAINPLTPNPCDPGPFTRCGPCVPNLRGFGYYDTSWRKWPGERRPDTEFPSSFGTEPMARPPAQERVPLPRPLPAEAGRAEPGIALPPGMVAPAAPTAPGVLTVPGGPAAPGAPAAPGTPPEKAAEPPATPPKERTPAAKEPAGPKLPGGEPLLEDGLKLHPEPAPKGPADTKAPPSGKEKPAGKEPASKEPAPRNERSPAPLKRPGGTTAGRRLHANWASALAVEDRGRTEVRSASYADSPAPSRGRAALEGYCPVRLTERQQWVQGDQRWAVRYQGRTFWFASATERKRFLAAPQRYLPAYGGNDPVLAAEENRRAVGKVQYCVVYGDDNRLYLFASQATLEQFRDDPKRYAVRPSRGTP